MSRKRQGVGAPEEPAVRALAARYPNGYALHGHAHDWSQLLYASEGVMVVETAEGAWVVPPHRAVWLPAGASHAITMRGTVAMRTVYFPGDSGIALERTTVVNVSPLLRELVVHCTTLGRLRLTDPHEARLAGLLVDLVSVVEAMPLALPMPRDPRAVRVAEAVRRDPANNATVGALARKAAAGARTIERLFLGETGMTFGAWRKQARLHHALVLLAQGMPVTNVAFEVGYASPSAFIATFKNALGTTPSRAFERQAPLLAAHDCHDVSRDA
jgi:AraC-like DNA-binding protein